MAAPQKKELKKKGQPVNSGNFSSGNLGIFLLIGAIALITYISFSPSLKNGFTNWDDNAYVFENMHLNKPIPEAAKYFFEPHYFIGNYIPVTMIAYTMEYHSAQLNPQFYHLINILIHLVNVALVFWFIYLLSGKKTWVAAIVSLFFGIHPMHVESVAWIAELKDVLYTAFFMAGLVTYYKFVELKLGKIDRQPETNLKKKLFYLPALTFIFFGLSVLSKPAAVTFPLVLLLLDFYTARKFDKWAWLEKLPFFIVSIVFGVIAIKSQEADRLLHDYYSLTQRFFFASHSFLEYLLKFVLPADLSIFYPYPALVNQQLPGFYYISPLLVIAIFYAVYRTLKHSRLIVFGFLFFLVNIMLVLQLISVGDAVMADRYT